MWTVGALGGLIGQIRTEAARRLYGNRAISVQSPHSLRKLSISPLVKTVDEHELQEISEKRFFTRDSIYPISRICYRRVGHGLDSSMDWIGLDWVGLDWVQFLVKKFGLNWIGSEFLSASLFFRKRKRLLLVFSVVQMNFCFLAN